MKKINEKLGTDYSLFNYYGAPDADRVSSCNGLLLRRAEEVIDYLNAHGEKVGLVKVRLYRPFSIKPSSTLSPRPSRRSPSWTVPRSRAHGRAALPGRRLRSLRGWQDGHQGCRRPLWPGLQGHPSRVRVRCLTRSSEGEPKREFTIGIVDDVTNLSLPEAEDAPNTAARAPSSASSGVWVATVPSAPTRTRSRSSATTPTSTSRPTSSTTPRRPAASPFAPALW